MLLPALVLRVATTSIHAFKYLYMALLDLAAFFLVMYSVSMKFLFYETQFSDHVPFDIAWNWG
jgi:hypothetical protein